METFLDYMKTPWISSHLSAWYLFQPNCLVWTVSQRTYNSVEQVSTSVLGDLETCRWLAGRWKVMATLSLTHTSWINWVLTYWSSISLPLAFLANLTYSSSFFLTLVSCTNMQSDVKIKQKLMTVNMCKISMDHSKYTCCTRLRFQVYILCRHSLWFTDNMCTAINTIKKIQIKNCRIHCQ